MLSKYGLQVYLSITRDQLGLRVFATTPPGYLTCGYRTMMANTSVELDREILFQNGETLNFLSVLFVQSL